MIYYFTGLNKHSFVDCSFFAKAGMVGLLSEKMPDY